MGRRGIELEAKFAPAGAQTLADLARRADFPGWRVAGRRDETQRNTYFDTAAGALEARHCSLRRRVLDGGAGGVEWTFKRGRGPGRDGVARRREINAILPGNKTDLPPPKVGCAPVERARRVTGPAPLLPLFTLLTERRQIDLVRADGARVALALDRVQLAEDPAYRETEIEIELLDGDEGAVANLAIWLMATYGLLPMRGSKRGRALAWRRGEGLPVVAPALALDLLAARATALAATVAGRPVTVALAAPRGSGQARMLAAALAERLPGACLVAAGAVWAGEEARGPLIVEGPDALDTGHADLCAWVKVGLPHPLLARLITDARAGGADDWAILRRCGEYVVPSQRRYIDPAARWADLVVIDNLPSSTDPDRYATPTTQVKLAAWPSATALAGMGAELLGADLEGDHFLEPPTPATPALVRVRLRADTAWVSLRDTGATEEIVTYEARPRVLALLHSLGYTDAGRLVKERRRYQTGGWEVTLDHVAGLGRWCELRRIAPDDRAAPAVATALGLGGAGMTTATYLALWHEEQEFAAHAAAGGARS